MNGTRTVEAKMCASHFGDLRQKAFQRLHRYFWIGTQNFENSVNFVDRMLGHFAITIRQQCTARSKHLTHGATHSNYLPRVNSQTLSAISRQNDEANVLFCFDLKHILFFQFFVDQLQKLQQLSHCLHNWEQQMKR